MVMTRQQKANETLRLWQELRDMTPAERLRKLDEFEAQLRAVQKEMNDVA